MNTNDGGPAFPQPATDSGHAANTPWAIAGGGLSLRDYFAAKTMCSSYWPILEAALRNGQGVEQIHSAVAQGAYAMADAMIAERVKATP